MPLFSLDDDEPTTELVPHSSSQTSSRSVSRPLSCLSPDGRFVYSFRSNNDGSMFMDAHHLPLEGYTEKPVDRNYPAVIQTKLSSTIVNALQVDSPVELFVCDGDSMPVRPPFHEHGPPQDCLLPLLCLYTRHSVFVLQLAFTVSDDYDKVVQGKVVSIKEPLESHLVGTTCTIIRVRPAPQRRMGYVTACPAGSMLMLTHNAVVNEYTLVQSHGFKYTTTPLSFRLEQLVENDVITDFSFGQSNGQALFASLSVHLLRATGQVLGASPILFEGTLVARSVVEDALEYLDNAIDTSQNTARLCQCMAARQYLQDAFKLGTQNYVTARMSDGVATENALSWPLSIQGPIIMGNDSTNHAVSIEPFYARDFVGVAIGRENVGVDFGAISPTSLLPRFDYMRALDQDAVDDFMSQLGAVVERISVESDTPEECMSLVRDPVVHNTIHYASSRGVVTITTNSMSIFSSKIREKAMGSTGRHTLLSPQKHPDVKTMAWSSLDISAGANGLSLIGAVVSADAHLGHTLVAILSDGSAEAVNLTESRYLHESASLFGNESKNSTEEKSVDQAIDATPPFHQLAKPLLESINDGLAGMAKIVGGQTDPSKITPGLLGTVIQIKERCESRVVLPLKELKQLTTSRRVELEELYASQNSLLKEQQVQVKLLQSRIRQTFQQLEVAESNFASLSQRSAVLLQASKDLRPTLTKAELDYFDLVKRVQAQCVKWQAKVAQLNKESSKLINAMNAGLTTVDVELSPQDEQNCHTLLRQQERTLDASEQSIQRTQQKVKSLVAATGLGSGGE